MHTLPSISIGKGCIQLAVSDASLAQLALLIHDRTVESDIRSRSINTLLVNEPALFLFLCHHYFTQNDGFAVDVESLSVFVPTNFGQSIAQAEHSEKHNVIDVELVEKELQRFRNDLSSKKLIESLANSSVQPIRRRLRKFCQAVTGSKKKQLKRWLKRIVSDAMLTSVFSDTSKRTCNNEAEDSNSGFDLARLFRILEDSAELHDNYEQKLLAEKLLSIKQLAYGASHEINNPLANISTRAQTLMLDETNPHRRYRLSVIYQQAMRAHEMISDLMLFAHPPKPQISSTDLFELSKSVIREMQPQLKHANVKVGVYQYPDAQQVECDSTQIADVLKALIRNSIEANVDGGNVQVRIWPAKDGRLCISVTDDGVGVSEAASRHLFDPFYSSREAGRGLGFGLSKAWTIVTRLHHGQILCRSSDEETTFEIELPVKHQSVESSNENEVLNCDTPISGIARKRCAA